jgi:hypothetical protein
VFVIGGPCCDVTCARGIGPTAASVVGQSAAVSHTGSTSRSDANKVGTRSTRLPCLVTMVTDCRIVILIYICTIFNDFYALLA